MMRSILIAAVLALTATGVHAASFNCARAKSADERTICKTQALSDADVKMATLYDVDTHLVAMGQRGDIQDAQADFLKTRKACGKGTSCLKRAYDKRIKDLQDTFDAIASRGPF